MDPEYRRDTDRELLEKIHRAQGATMAAIDDLTAKVSEVLAEQAAVDKAVTDLVAAVQASASVNDPAIEAAVAQLETVRTAQVADAATDPAPAPAPAS